MAIDKILVAVDGSRHSRRAIAFAADMALHFGSEVVVLHVVHGGVPHVPADVAAYERYEHVQLTQSDLLQASGEEIVERAEKQLRDVGVSDVSTVVEVGHPAEVISRMAEYELGADDVIVMGRRGLGHLSALVVGSVSHKVAHNVDRTLITVR